MTNKRLNTLNGVLNAISIDLVAPFAVLFALRLGADNLQTAFLSSGPALAGLLILIPGARWVDRQANKRRVIAGLMSVNRLFYLLMVFVPFLWPSAQAATFILLVTVMNAPGALATSAWQGWMARVFSPDKRADAFADRTLFMNFFGTATTILAGAFLDTLGATWGYQLLFFGAFLVAVAEVKVFTRIQAPPHDPGPVSALPHAAESAVQPEHAAAQDGVQLSPVLEAPVRLPRVSRFRRRLGDIASNRTFVLYTAASIVFYFAWQTPWTIFSLYQVKALGAGNAVMGLLSVMNTGGNLLGYKFWVGQIEKKGNLHVQWLAALTLVASPFIYAATTLVPRVNWLGMDASLWIIAVFTFIVGAALSGLTVALFNSLLEATPEQNRTTYIAYYNTAITITAVVAPLWGVFTYELWGWQVAFLVMGAQRIVGVLALIFLWRAR